MAVGFPTKVTYANGDVYSAGDANDTNGTLNLLNPTAKGSLVSASAADTPSRLAVGANDTVLTADSSTTTGLKWAAISAGGITLLSTTTLSGTSVTVSSIDQTYEQLFVTVAGVAFSGGGTAILQLQANGSSTLSRVSGFDAAAGASFTGASGNVMQAAVAFPVYNISLPNYTNPDIGKVGVGSSGAGGGSGARAIFSYFYDSADVITSLKVAANGSTFTQGFIKIWGIK